MHIKILRKFHEGCATCLGKQECSSSGCNHLRLSPKSLTQQTIHNKHTIINATLRKIWYAWDAGWHKGLWYERPANKIRERPNITMSQKAKARSKLSQINIIK